VGFFLFSIVGGDIWPYLIILSSFQLQWPNIFNETMKDIFNIIFRVLEHLEWIKKTSKKMTLTYLSFPVALSYNATPKYAPETFFNTKNSLSPPVLFILRLNNFFFLDVFCLVIK
jgi:hypothetical protein